MQSKFQKMLNSLILGSANGLFGGGFFFGEAKAAMIDGPDNNHRDPLCL